MIDLNTCHKSTASGNILTPKGKLFFAQFLYEPQENQQGKLKYNLDICIPPSADLTLLKNEMARIALENLDGDKIRAKNFVEKRFIDPNNKPQGGKPAGPEYDGWVSIRASSDVRPDFVLPNGERIDESKFKQEIYSGRWARASLNPYWSKISTNPGVFMGLSNIQLLDHDDPIGFVKIQGQDEFGAVEGYDNASSKSSKSDEDVDALFN